MCGLMRLGYIPPPSKIICLPQASTRLKTPPDDFGGVFEEVLDDGEL